MTGPATLCTDNRATLGEGARWHATTRELLWVDITAGRLFREYVADDAGPLTRVATHDVGMPLGAVAPVMGANGWMLAAGGGFACLGENGSLRVLAQPEAGRAARMNDAACDSQGRFWAGSLADDHAAGAGSLYVLHQDGTVQRMLAGLTIPNGIGWSPNGSAMYLVDSGLSCVFEFDFDAREGELASRRVLIELGGDEGVPDGLTVDNEGCLWVAVYGGWEVRRYTPRGELLERVPIPAAQVTCCCFGGPEGTTLFVTTAREGFGNRESREQPLAGSLFAVPTSMAAPPVAEFQPTPKFLASLTGDD